ncbi:MAG: MFS transporter [Bifidobacterium sp.]|nr:MFS transporter [Bifidobacterium sp.]
MASSWPSSTFNQAVGQNTISYYGPTMFSSIGFKNNGEFIASTVVGAVELVFTFVGMALIDKVGRKPLMQSGSFLMGVFAILMALTYGLHWQGIWMLIFACCFIAAFAYSMGPVTWVMIPELFPTYLRGRASGICTVFLWGVNFLIGQFTPVMFSHWGGAGMFGFFAALDFICCLGVTRLVPETKGRSLEEIEDYWKTRSTAKAR